MSVCVCAALLLCDLCVYVDVLCVHAYCGVLDSIGHWLPAKVMDEDATNGLLIHFEGEQCEANACRDWHGETWTWTWAWTARCVLGDASGVIAADDAARGSTSAAETMYMSLTVTCLLVRVRTCYRLGNTMGRVSEHGACLICAGAACLLLLLLCSVCVGMTRSC